MTCGPSLGRSRQSFVTVRVDLGAAGVVGARGVGPGRLGQVGVPVAGRGHQRDAGVVGVLERGGDGLLGQRLLGQLLLGDRSGEVVVGRVAVVEPRIGVEAHVDHVEPGVRRVGEGGDRLVQEEVARVLAGADVDDRGVGGHAGRADAVVVGGDDAGDVGAVTALVDVGRVDAGRDLARPVDARDVHREVARQLGVEVGGEVGMGRVDAGVDDADGDAGAGGAAVGVGDVHLRHVPLAVGERLGPPGAPAVRAPGGARAVGGALVGRRPLLDVAVLLTLADGADRVVAGHGGHGVGGLGLGGEGAVGRLDQGDAHGLVDVDDGAPGGRDGLGGGGGVPLVGDDELAALWSGPSGRWTTRRCRRPGRRWPRATTPRGRRRPRTRPAATWILRMRRCSPCVQQFGALAGDTLGSSSGSRR